MAQAVDRFKALDTAQPRSLGHVLGLDGVRALAVILVVAFHWGFLWRPESHGVVKGGYVGVDVFFVLSGFLITSILVGERAKRGDVAFGRFYVRRALRLMPALLVFLAAHVVYSVWQGMKLGEEIRQVFFVVFYVANFAQAYWVETFRPGLVITWSLSIEEQFYLVWPAAFLFGILRAARNRAMVLGIILGGALASALIRAYLFEVADSSIAATVRPDARADGLLIGAACALLWRWRMVSTKWLSPLATLSVVLLLVFSYTGPGDESRMYLGGYTLVSIASALVILAVAENVWRFQKVAEWSPLRLIGKVSYGIYLWHTLTMRIAGEFVDDPWARLVLGTLITAVAVGGSWVLVETPALKFKDRKTALPVSA